MILLRIKRKTNLLTILGFCLIFLFPACKSVKLADGTKLKNRKPAFLLEQLNANKKQAEWMSAKANIKYRDDNQGISLTSYIRLKKDSLIWLNVKKFGIEAARIQITPDSIYIMDRINKQYTVKEFDFVHRQFNMPSVVAKALDFKALQNIFLGNPVFIPIEKMTATIDKEGYRLDGTYEDIESQTSLNGKDYELTNIQFTDNYDGKEVRIGFDNYQSVDKGGNFSYFRTINLTSTQTGTVAMTIDLSKLELDIPTTFNFNVPSKYTRIE